LCVCTITQHKSNIHLFVEIQRRVRCELCSHFSNTFFIKLLLNYWWIRFGSSCFTGNIL